MRKIAYVIALIAGWCIGGSLLFGSCLAAVAAEDPSATDSQRNAALAAMMVCLVLGLPTFTVSAILYFKKTEHWGSPTEGEEEE